MVYSWGRSGYFRDGVPPACAGAEQPQDQPVGKEAGDGHGAQMQQEVALEIAREVRAAKD